MWSPSSPTRPRLSRRPTALSNLVKDVDANLAEVGQKLAAEFRDMFNHQQDSESSNSSLSFLPMLGKPKAKPVTQTPVSSTERLVLNISSPLSLQFPASNPDSPFTYTTTTVSTPSSVQSTPSLVPSCPSLASKPSCESFLDLASTVSGNSCATATVTTTPAESNTTHPEIPEDPYLIQPDSDLDVQDRACLRASSARAAFLLPPQPQFHDVSECHTKLRAHSDENLALGHRLDAFAVHPRSPSLDMRIAGFEGAKRSQSYSPRKSYGRQPRVRSVRSFIIDPAVIDTRSSVSSSPTPLLPRSPSQPYTALPITTRRSLSSGIGIDWDFRQRADRQPSPPPHSRQLSPRRPSSARSTSSFARSFVSPSPA